ncbi:MAG: glycosyl hydrolase [Saccharofermentanales bacterium]
MKNNKVMSVDEITFRNPPAEHRVFQYVQGSKLKIDKMIEMNLGGGVCGVSWGADYLHNEDSWATLVDDIGKAKEAGLITWIFDEKGYPSGCAGGLTTEGMPELEARGIYSFIVEGNGKKHLEVPLPEGAERFINAWLFPVIDSSVIFEASADIAVSDTEITTDGIDGDWKIFAVAEKIMFEGTHAYLMMKSWKATGHYPNLMDREAVKRFIDITYEAYKERLGDFEGSADIFAFYTNEPSLMTHWVDSMEDRPNGECYAPWERTIPARFKEKYGYDPEPLIYKLFAGDDAASKILRHHYYSIVGDLMAENFSGQLAEWCEANNTRLSGHILCEEYMGQHVPLFGDFIRVMGRFSIPGADWAIRPHGKDRTDDMMGLRYVSSAARIYGKPLVQTLMDPILGGYFTDNRHQVIPVDVLTANLNLLFYCGINVITTYGIWEEYKTEDYVQYNNYAGRLSILLRGATDKSNVAVYYPIETFQGRYFPSPKYIHFEHYVYADIENPQKAIIKTFAENNVDFNYLNAVAINDAVIEDGNLMVEGHVYRVVIMPAVEILDLAVAEKLRSFAVQGGTLIFTDSIPDIAANESDTEKLKTIFADCSIVESYDQIIPGIRPVLDSIDPDLKITGENIQFARFVKDSKNLVFIMNPTEVTANGILQINGAKEVKIYDPDKGTVIIESLPFSFEIGSSLSFVAEY